MDNVLIVTRFARRALLLAAVCLGVPGSVRAAPVDFARDVRPVLADKCFSCHGPDARKGGGGLRLDQREPAIAAGAIVPGKPDESPLVRRTHTTEPGERMPPAGSGKTLTPAEQALLREWVATGAAYQPHWAFVLPARPPIPVVTRESWPRNPIDRFVLARLERERLAPSPEAAKAVLARRVSLDLTGLPPSPEELDAFLQETSPDAYERLVDRLLASPRYGEHMARSWLDAARFGDTHGLHIDNYREMYPYRDWVVAAYNRNLPYDRFLTEQLAGDLLPHAGPDPEIATGFLRCHVTTNECGTIEEEAHVRNVRDRVDTVGTVVLGLTFTCAKCHDHKYDPLTAKDYYAVFAFFNSLDGSPLDGNSARHPPIMRVPTPELTAKLKTADERLARHRDELRTAARLVTYDPATGAGVPEEAVAGDHVWIDDELPPGARPIIAGGVSVFWDFVGKPAPVARGDKAVRIAAGTKTQQVVFQGARPGLTVGKGDTLFAHVWLDPADPPKALMLQWRTTRWAHRAYWGENVFPWGEDESPERRRMGDLPAAGRWVRLEIDVERVGIAPGAVVEGWAFSQHGGTAFWDSAGTHTRLPQDGRLYDTLAAWVGAQKLAGGHGLPDSVRAAVNTPAGERTRRQEQELLDYFTENAFSGGGATLAPLRRQIAALEREKAALEDETPTTLVFRERAEPRPAFVLKRGNYDSPGERVGRGTPAFLPPFPADAPKDRLGFARWATAPDHPLTARVAVNRLWQQFFGTGLVKTAGDFGVRGDAPSHPELLDWLATRFVADGWDVKKTVRRIVTSATYRQSACAAADARARDPDNCLLARGPRLRLDAEVLRDQALFVGGLLVEKLGGPPVKPPQPPGLWEAVAFPGSNTGVFEADRGHEKAHRRSLYTFWKRTAPPPQLTILDAPSREACTVRRERTNTPLQALLVMNAEVYVEAARGLATRTLREAPADTDTRLRYLFRLATARAPDAAELAVLRDDLRGHLANFREKPGAARRLVGVGVTPPDGAIAPEELAAWTMVGNLVLNLDEVLNH